MFVFGHRGGAPQFPECTAEALAAGIAAGAGGVEFDIRMTSDGHVVLNHDRTLIRVWGVSRSVREISLREVRGASAGGCRVATIDEALAAVGDGISVIDCKETDAIAPTVAAIARHGAMGRVVFVGDGFPLFEVRALVPAADISLTWWDATEPRPDVLRTLRPRYFSQSFDALEPGIVERQHAAGREVWTWQVNGRAALDKAFACGVDGVATDNVVELMRDLRDRDRDRQRVG